MPIEAWHDDSIPLLPTEILNDDWVLYHGTSNLCENDIDVNGFRSDRASLITKETVQRIVACFKRLNWYGDDPGGYSILLSFTAQHDHSYETGKPIFLGESCRRSLLYATKDFAGGGGCRSLRKAIKDLRAYLTDEEVRYSALTKQIHETVNGYGEVIYSDVTPPAAHELEWLQDELASLQSIERFVNERFDRYQYGIVYALRFNKGDLGYMNNNSRMGIVHHTSIAPDKIVAKLYVNSDTRQHLFVEDNQRIVNAIAWSSRVSRSRILPGH